MSADRPEIYICCPPARLWVTILVHPLALNDDIPEEADIQIEIAVLGMKGGRAGGIPGMRAKDMKGWQKEAKREKDT